MHQGRFREDVYDQACGRGEDRAHPVCYSDLPGRSRPHRVLPVSDRRLREGAWPTTFHGARRPQAHGSPGRGLRDRGARGRLHQTGESDDEVWRRAVAEVFSYWSHPNRQRPSVR